MKTNLFLNTGRRLLMVGAVLIAGSGWLVGADGSDERRIIAVYGNAITLSPLAKGWRFETAVDGDGDAGLVEWEELTRIEQQSGRRRSTVYGKVDGDGQWLNSEPYHRQWGHVYAARDSEERAAWAVASYTLQQDSSGEVWLTNGNFRNRGAHDGVVLAIYRNDELLQRLTVPVDEDPTLFQQHLGTLKKGDTIRVAVGPPDGARGGGGSMHFTIEEFPAGRQPDGPVNIILSSAIDAAEPRRDPDGGYKNYAERQRAHCELVLERQPELVFIGDSITARWPQERLEKHFGDYRPVNLGIGGDWIQNVLWRVRNGVLDRVEINTIVLLIGTNNIANRFSAEDIAAGIDNLLTTIHQVSPESRVLLLGILPRTGRLNKQVLEANQLLAKLDDGQRVFFLDVGHALVETDGSIAPEVMPDGLHVADPGFERWMQAMQPKLSEVLRR